MKVIFGFLIWDWQSINYAGIWRYGIYENMIIGFEYELSKICEAETKHHNSSMRRCKNWVIGDNNGWRE